MTKILDQQALSNRLIELLRTNPMFAELTDEQIIYLAQQAHFEEYEAGESLARQGDSDQGFYIIVDGQVRITDDTDEKTKIEAYRFEGDLGGELALLANGFQPVREEAAVDSLVAKFDKDTFEWLISAAPELATKLHERAAFFKRKDLVFFEGQRRGEAVIINTRRHFMAFLANLPGALLLMILGTIVGLLLIDWLDVTAYIVSGCIFSLGLLVTLYVYIDWRNDSFILTSQRAIHIERILLHGETRHEAPLTSIQDVGILVPGFIASLFDYSDLHIKTAGAGTLIFDGLKNTKLFKDEIFRQRQKAQERAGAADVRDVRQKLRKIIVVDEAADQVYSTEPDQAVMLQKPSHKLPGFINFFIPRTKEVKGDTIIWRKNHFVFLKLVLLPLLMGLALIYLILAAFFGFYPFSAPSLIWVLTLIIAWLLNLVWYAYQYDTWRKDEYRVTRSAIIDYKGSAFNLGGEQQRAGTFDVIQNSTYVTPTFWAKFLNIGHVVIETAGTEMTFTFAWVYNPVEVQQEIFRRWLAYKESKVQQDRAYEEKRFIRWLGEFHELSDSTAP